MAHFLNIAGLVFYMVFRVIILPVLVVVGCLFMLLAIFKGLKKLHAFITAIRPARPLYRFARLRFHFSK